jgi:hypothetical protein
MKSPGRTRVYAGDDHPATDDVTVPAPTQALLYLFSAASAASEFSRVFQGLGMTQTFARKVYFGFQPAKAGSRIQPGVEREGA